MARIITLPGSGAWQERYDVFTIVLDPERFDDEQTFLDAVKRYLALAEEINLAE